MAAWGPAPRERLRMDRPAVLQELCATAPGAISVDQAGTWTVTTCAGAAVSSLAQRKAAQRAAREAAAQDSEAAFRKAMHAKRERAAAAREANFRRLCDDVLGGLERHGMTPEATAAVEHAAAEAADRRRTLHAAWSTQVFQRMSDRVQAAVAAKPIAELEASLRAASDAYLRASNAKAGVYRDVVIAGDYDPFERSRLVIRVPMKDVADPLKRDLLRAQEERMLLPSAAGGGCGADSARQLAPAALRHTLDVRCWGAGTITATPYGRCITADGQYHVRPAAPASLAQAASRLCFDDFGCQTAAPYRPSKRMLHADRAGGAIASGAHPGGSAGSAGVLR